MQFIWQIKFEFSHFLGKQNIVEGCFRVTQGPEFKAPAILNTVQVPMFLFRK